MPANSSTFSPVPQEAAQINRELLNAMGERVSRKDFLRILAEATHPICNFSWLLLSLRDQREEILADYSNPAKKTSIPSPRFFPIP